jgi:hypothetical protein
MSHDPEHSPVQLPESLPGSHSTLADPGFTLASHCAAQSAIAFIDASQWGGLASSTTRADAPILARASSIALIAA